MLHSESTNHLQSQGGEPKGFVGYIIGKLMNLFHITGYMLALSKLPVADNLICLDIGCGGGKLVNLLASQIKNGKIYGLDHSEQMVKLARKVNNSFIENGIVEILQGTVSALPFSDSQFDLITAFETIHFWPDLDTNLKEIPRKLKSSGKFMIVNRFPQEGTKWFNFVQIKNADEYKNKLVSAGFSDISVDIESKKGWIIVLAQ